MNHHLDSLTAHLVNELHALLSAFDVNSTDHIRHQILITSSFYLRLRTDRVITATNELQSTDLISTLPLPSHVIFVTVSTRINV